MSFVIEFKMQGLVYNHSVYNFTILHTSGTKIQIIKNNFEFILNLQSEEKKILNSSNLVHLGGIYVRNRYYAIRFNQTTLMRRLIGRWKRIAKCCAARIIYAVNIHYFSCECKLFELINFFFFAPYTKAQTLR